MQKQITVLEKKYISGVLSIILFLLIPVSIVDAFLSDIEPIDSKFSENVVSDGEFVYYKELREANYDESISTYLPDYYKFKDNVLTNQYKMMLQGTNVIRRLTLIG